MYNRGGERAKELKKKFNHSENGYCRTHEQKEMKFSST